MTIERSPVSRLMPLLVARVHTRSPSTTRSSIVVSTRDEHALELGEAALVGGPADRLAARAGVADERLGEELVDGVEVAVAPDLVPPALADGQHRRRVPTVGSLGRRTSYGTDGSAGSEDRRASGRLATMTYSTDRHRHLEQRAALRRPGRGRRRRPPSWRSSATARCGSPTSAATCSAPSPTCSARRRRRRSPPASSTSGCTRRRRRPPATPRSTAEHGRRFLVGIGVSHAPLIDRVKEAGTYQQPLAADARRTSTGSTPPIRRWPPTTGCSPRSGRRCSSWPAPRTAGAHPYLVTPEHSRIAREALGAGRARRHRAGRRAGDRPRARPGRSPAPTWRRTSACPTTPTTGCASGFTERRPRRRRQRPPRRRPRRVGSTRRRSPRVSRSTATPAPTTCACRSSPTTRVVFPLEQWRALAPRTHAMNYDFDRYLRYDELTAWLHALAADHPDLVAVESYGRSHEGRDLWLVTVTDAATGRPRHQAGALGRRQHPRRRADGDGGRLRTCSSTSSTATPPATRRSRRRCATRTFYVVPRVNPDGAEWALADAPRFRRSSTRPWPWADAHRWPGLHVEDVDGDGRVLQMRIADPDGAWMPHPDDARLLVPVPPAVPPTGHASRYRLLDEGTVVDHDGFTIPTPRPPEGLDLNRNFPAGWGTGVRGSRRPPAVRAGDRRPRAGHRRPAQRLRLQRLPHQRRRAPAAVVDAARLGAAARSTCGRGSSSARSAPR